MKTYQQDQSYINMEKVFNKLVRDNIPDIIKKNKEVPTTRVLNDEEYKEELLKKLFEECQEVRKAQTIDEITEELADVYEVLLVIAKLNGKTIRDIETVSTLKREKRGSFDKRIFLEKTSSKIDK